jgi:membrane fusion protein (multidrug efflux system)
VNQRTGTVQARISVPNPEGALRPGMFVRLKVPSLQSGNALTVPQKAVTELQGLKLVYVIGPDGKPQQRQIVADVRTGSDWVVEKGLAPGEMVVVEGLPKLQLMPNAVVKPVIVTNQPAAPTNVGAPTAATPGAAATGPAGAGSAANPPATTPQAPSPPANPPPTTKQRGTSGVPSTAG